MNINNCEGMLRVLGTDYIDETPNICCSTKLSVLFSKLFNVKVLEREVFYVVQCEHKDIFCNLLLSIVQQAQLSPLRIMT